MCPPVPPPVNADAKGHGYRVRRATFMISATATRLTISDVPPNEMNGSGTPVTGHDDVTTADVDEGLDDDQQRANRR